jgi:uncharacterized protein (UPF0248 family)
MNLHEKLQKLLTTDCLKKVSNGTLLLKGGDRADKYSIEITGIDNQDIAVINLGKNPHSSLINESGGYKKICDYLILLPQSDKILVLLCELKRTYQSKGGDQLEASIPFIEYIQSMLRIHFDENRDFQHHFLILAIKKNNRLAKDTIKADPISVISYKNLKIRLIIGNRIPFHKIIEYN